jgi:hypothetical protein
LAKNTLIILLFLLTLAMLEIAEHHQSLDTLRYIFSISFMTIIPPVAEDDKDGKHRASEEQISNFTTQIDNDRKVQLEDEM